MIETLAVVGMKCGGCENTVNTALQAIEGVISVQASSKTNEVNIEFDDTKTDLTTLKTAITQAGFSVA